MKEKVNDSLLCEKTSDTWRRWPGSAPCRSVMGDVPSAIKGSFPLHVPAPSVGPRRRLSADRKRQHVPDTLSRRRLLSAASLQGPWCCWNERRGIVCVFTQIQQQQPGCLLCSAGHISHAKTPSSGSSRAGRITSGESLGMKVAEQERELMRFARSCSRTNKQSIKQVSHSAAC